LVVAEAVASEVLVGAALVAVELVAAGKF